MTGAGGSDADADAEDARLPAAHRPAAEDGDDPAAAAAAAAPPSREYDVVVCGTDLAQSILASALSRAGQRVLHVDGERRCHMPRHAVRRRSRSTH